ncbi:MAG TPA: HEAT repeat domain-containing protein, partial [Longimicrobiaceae bacterium]|nr:HEAT repeat domain-containing protein [Longimicrobiaceae bacterium]
MPSRSILLLLGMSLMLAACAAPAVGPYPQALGEAEIDALATLLRLEDRREFDEALLREIAASPMPEVRRRAALAAGRIRHPGATPLLLPLLDDPDTSVAAIAAFSLGQQGDTSAVALLAALLTGEAIRRAPTVAAEAAGALGKIRGEPARQALLSVLRDTPPGDRGAAEAVGAALLAVWKFQRDPDLEPIRRWTSSADPQLRWRAAYALVRRPDPAATPVLLGLASDPEPQVRSLAIRGLTAPLADSADIGAAATLPVVLAALRDGNYLVRVNAVRTLGTYGDAAAVQSLTDLLNAAEPHLALAAAESLGRLGVRAAAAAPALRGVA